MKEKNAIDLIYDIHAMLENLDKRMTLLEKSMLLLSDKVNPATLSTFKVPTIEATTVKSTASITIGPERLENQPIIINTPQGQVQTQTPKTPGARVFGKFLDMRKKPISDIEVTILDANNNVIKQTRTNRAGEWMSNLPPGQYSAEFIKEGMAPQFKTFQIFQGQSVVEVM